MNWLIPAACIVGYAVVALVIFYACEQAEGMA